MTKVIKNKIRRLRSGNTPRVLDLFGGCGGLTLGFTTAGFESLGAVEIDKRAAQSHGLNFFSSDPAHSAARSVNTDPEALLNEICALRGKERIDTKVDVLVGGPPCQAFSRVGIAKLREIARKNLSPDAEKAHLVDDRVKLYLRYLLYVKTLKPIAIIMENVPDILNHGGNNVAEEIAHHLEDLGYQVEYRLLNASNFGVPQTRERMILQAIHQDAVCEILWPKPTHHCDLPTGYKGTRATALKLINNQHSSIIDSTHYAFSAMLDLVDHQGADKLSPAVSAENALGNLPKIKTLDRNLRPLTEKGPRDLSIEISVHQADNGYADLMQHWPGFEGAGGTTAHVIRHLPRDYKIFRKMKHGWQYPQIHAWVEAKREALLQARYDKGLSTDPSDPEVAEIIQAWKIPYDPDKFPNKWWKLIPEKPSRTLLAHLEKDGYSHIHYDCDQARTISVREAARLQSFPDGFRFSGSMNPGFKQIGNAVPPLFSYSLAMAMREALKLDPMDDIRTTIMGVPKHLTGTLKRDR